jgi:hypothetical protein
MREIFLFWMSLASTSFFMALELPICTAAISRLDNVEINLAAIGIISSFSLFVQSPVLRILSLPLIFMNDKNSFKILRKFCVIFCILISIMFFILSSDLIFRNYISTQLNLSLELTNLIQKGLYVWSIFPLIIGLRRFYQGILLCAHEPNKIAYSTAIRLSTLFITILTFSYFKTFSGTIIAVSSIGIAMFVEMLASRFFAQKQINKFLEINSPPENTKLNFLKIIRTYVPLSFSTTVAMSSGPILSFFTAKGLLSFESLVISPIIFGILNPFTWSAFAIQDTTHALLKKDPLANTKVKYFAVYIGLILSIILFIFGITPLSDFYLKNINKLNLNLIELCAIPILTISLIPILVSLKNFYRGKLISENKINLLFYIECLEIISLATFFIMFLNLIMLPAIYLLFFSLSCSYITSILCLNLFPAKLRSN